MRIKLPNTLLIIDLLVVIVILISTFTSADAVRIILGLPFLLFFPGYVLMSALFPRKEGLDGIEDVALIFGISIAIVAIIGFVMNNTWGLQLLPILYAVSAFIVATSVVAMLRQGLFKAKNLTMEIKLRLPRWEADKANKFQYIILTISVLAAIGVLGYVLATPKVEEEYTEYYLLGFYEEARDYPTEFIINDGEISSVLYGTETTIDDNSPGKVIVGIVNHEQQKTTYIVRIKIDGEQVDMHDSSGVTIYPQLGPIELSDGEAWEQEIGIVPQHIAETQKVEFSLYKNGGNESYLELYFWINVR